METLVIYVKTDTFFSKQAKENRSDLQASMEKTPTLCHFWSPNFDLELHGPKG